MNLVRLAFFSVFLSTPLWAQHETHVASSRPSASAVIPTAGQELAAAAAGPHAGPDMRAIPAASVAAAAPAIATAPAALPMAGHDMATMDPQAAPLAPTALPPEAFDGPEHAADVVFGSEAMAEARRLMRNEHGNFRALWLAADRLEARVANGENAYLWDLQGWYGGDINKLWVKSEGETASGAGPEEFEAQVLWSHAIAPWWDIQAGVRHDFGATAERSHLVLGLQGLMPYQFALVAAAFVSDDGGLSARVAAEYDLWLSQRLLLQPRLEVNFAGQDLPEFGIGSGLGVAELGWRLRYQLVREFAPYIGVEYERRFGHTADFARAAGDDTGGWNFVMGLRAWF